MKKKKKNKLCVFEERRNIQEKRARNAFFASNFPLSPFFAPEKVAKKWVIPFLFYSKKGQ